MATIEARQNAVGPDSGAGFRTFYRERFRAEHRHPVNVALHVTGTLLGIVWVVGSLLAAAPLALLLFPVVHAAPGLLGHRLFERDAAIGDLRVTRTDFPLIWFIAANHVLAWDVVRGRWKA